MKIKPPASGPVNGFLRAAAFLQAMGAAAGMVYFFWLLPSQGFEGLHHIILSPLMCGLALVASVFLFQGRAWAKVLTWILQLAQVLQVSLPGFAYLCYLGVGVFVQLPDGRFRMMTGGMLYLDLLPKTHAVMSLNLVPIGMVLLLGLSCLDKDCKDVGTLKRAD